MLLKSLALTMLLLAPLALSPASAAGETLTLAMDADTYSAASTLTGAAPQATITVDSENGPLAGVQVRVVFIRQVQFVGNVANETIFATTGPDGTVTVAAPQLSGLPGSYFVVAFAAGAAGSDRYSVGA